MHNMLKLTPFRNKVKYRFNPQKRKEGARPCEPFDLPLHRLLYPEFKKRLPLKSYLRNSKRTRKDKRMRYKAIQDTVGNYKVYLCFLGRYT